MIIENFIFDPDKTVVNFITDLERTDTRPFDCSVTSSGCSTEITYSKLFDYIAETKNSFNYITHGGFKKGSDEDVRSED